MNSLPSKLVWLMCLSLLSASALPREVVVLEQALETSTDLAALPTSVPSVVTARTCSSCEVHVLHVDNTTRFFTSRKTPASIAQLSKACGTRTVNVGIFFDAKTKVVTRIVTGC
jgi:hypothetical protein